MSTQEKLALLPAATPETAPYWEGLDAGELRLQTCDDCGHFRFPQSPVCPKCLSPHATWRAASGRATLWSWIRMHQKYFPAYADDIPYVVAFVRLEEGPMFISTVVDPIEKLAIDSPLSVFFEDIGDDRKVAKFRLA